MRVLVTGANGFIGLQTAIQLRIEGYVVYGLIRNKDHAGSLERHEIIPVVGDITDSKALDATLDKVSVVIDNVMSLAGQDPAKFADPNRALVALIQASAKRTGVRKRYIYTSGCLVLGNQPGKALTEEDPCQSQFLGWRAAFEREVIALGGVQGSHVDGSVLRPGFVYGTQWGPLLTPWFHGDKDGNIEIVGNPDKRWAWIHLYDLAAAYVAVVGNKSTIGELFNIGDDTRATYAQIKEGCARAAGVQGKCVAKPAPSDFFGMLLEGSANCVVSSEKLKKMTGWRTKHGPVFDQIEIYHSAIKAHAASGAAKKAH